MTKVFPYTTSKAEDTFFENTPKRILFAMARDYAIQTIGEDVFFADNTSLMEELENRKRIIIENGLDKWNS